MSPDILAASGRSRVISLALAALFVASTLPASAQAPAGWMVEIQQQPDQSVVSGVTPISGISARDGNRDGFVVIAFIDTGINPYSIDFAPVPEQPSVHPSNYIAGYPAATPAIDLNCTATTNIPALCAGDFTGVQQGRMYWFPGTKIIGAISFGNSYTTPNLILDDDGHGTKSISVAAGNIAGNCPQCLIVSIEGLGDQGMNWAAQQPWIDIFSNSWGTQYNAGAPNGNCAGGSCATKPMAESGASILFAAGNGYENAFVTPQMDYTSPYAGVDWHVIVGAAHTANNGSIAGSGKPVTVTGYGAGNIPSACPNVRTVTCNHSGTSAATPQVAGVFGAVLDRARLLMGDTTEGPRGALPTTQGTLGIAAAGNPVPGNQYLDDGMLTRQELWSLAMRTAAPLATAPSAGPPATVGATPGDYSYAGYGLVTRWTRNTAVDLLSCGANLPDTQGADDYIEQDSTARQAAWGTWTEAGARKMGDVGNVVPPVPPCTPGAPPSNTGPAPEVVLTVGGVAAGSVLPNPDGTWATTIDFDGYVPVQGAYLVRAVYGPVSHMVTYYPPRETYVEPPVHPDVQAMLGGPFYARPGQPISIKTTLTGGTAPFTCTWSGASFSTQTCDLATLWFEDVGSFHVSFLVVDANGKFSFATALVRIGQATADTDQDGVNDLADNCPDVPNANQADQDRDGQGDACDARPTIEGPEHVVAEARPASRGADLDQDGVPDREDNCPTVANAWQADLDGDMVGDACDRDLDGDGILNSDDGCPLVPDRLQGDADLDGRGDACHPPEGARLAVQDASVAGASENAVRNPPVLLILVGLAILAVLGAAILGGVHPWWQKRQR